MTDAIVDAKNLTKTYPLGRRKVEALRGIDLQLRRGDFAVLLGPSGAGKTTTLNLLGCLDRPSGGELRVGETQVFGNGKPLHESQLDRIRRSQIGFVFTEFFLLPTLSAVENVEVAMLWTGGRDRQKSVALLEAVGLGHRLTHRPTELSGGEMQRVAIARALANDPDLLLADEPTGNLDTRTRDEIFAVLDQLNQERSLTVLIATHDRDLAERVPRVIHLRDGRIAGGDGDDS
jgi:putative ABC transport system ATP-binding protein